MNKELISELNYNFEIDELKKDIQIWFDDLT